MKMTQQKYKVSKKVVKESDLNQQKRKPGKPIHSFKASKIPLSVSLAKKGPLIFDLTS